MYCSQCGKQVADDAAFCAHCGKELKAETQQEIAEEAVQQEVLQEAPQPEVIQEAPRMQTNYAQPQQPEKKKSNPMAVTAFVTTLASLFCCGGILNPLALIFSIIGLVKSKKSGKGKGFSIASLVINIIVVLLLVAVFVLPLVLSMFGATSSYFLNDLFYDISDSFSGAVDDEYDYYDIYEENPYDNYNEYDEYGYEYSY